MWKNVRSLLSQQVIFLETCSHKFWFPQKMSEQQLLFLPRAKLLSQTQTYLILLVLGNLLRSHSQRLSSLSTDLIKNGFRLGSQRKSQTQWSQMTETSGRTEKKWKHLLGQYTPYKAKHLPAMGAKNSHFACPGRRRI